MAEPGLAAMTWVYTYRRMLRTLGYRGVRVRFTFGLLVGAVMVLEVVACLSVRWAVQGRLDGGLLQLALPLLVIGTLQALSGPQLLLAETAVAGSQPVVRFLETLPLTRRRRRLVLLAPPLITAALLLGLLVPPAVLVLTMLEYSLPVAALFVVATVSVSGAVSLTALAILKVAMPGARWSVLHYPVSLLVTLACTAYGVVRLVADPLRLTLADWVVASPVLLQIASGARPTSVPVLLAYAGSGLVVTAVAAAAVVAHSSRTGAVRRVVTWRISDRPRLFVGELVQLFRVPAVVANLLSAVLVNMAIAYGLLRLGDRAFTAVAGPVLLVMALIAALPVRMGRGTVRTTIPEPQLAGVGLTAWLPRAIAAQLLLGLLGLLPVIALLGRLFAATSTTWPSLLVGAAGYVLVAVLVGWLAPIPVDDSTGQVVATWIYMLVSSAIVAPAGFVAWTTLPALAVTAGLIALVLTVVVGIERSRWQLTSSSRPFAPSPQEVTS